MVISIQKTTLYKITVDINIGSAYDVTMMHYYASNNGSSPPTAQQIVVYVSNDEILGDSNWPASDSDAPYDGLVVNGITPIVLDIANASLGDVAFPTYTGSGYSDNSLENRMPLINVKRYFGKGQFIRVYMRREFRVCWR